MKQNSSYLKMALLFCALFITLSILAVFALTAAVRKNAETADWIKTTAEIVDFDYAVTVESEKTVISFSDKDGQVHIMPLGFYSIDMYIGMKVPIAYNENDISSIIYLGNNSFFVNYGGSIMLAAGALISCCAAVAMYVRLRSKRVTT